MLGRVSLVHRRDNIENEPDKDKRDFNIIV